MAARISTSAAGRTRWSDPSGEAVRRASGSLFVGGVLEEHGDLDAPVANLREAGRAGIARVEVRRRVIGREEHQRVQELYHFPLPARRQPVEEARRLLRL